MKLKNIIYNSITYSIIYSIIGTCFIVIIIAFIATLCGDGNKGLFELLQ